MIIEENDGRGKEVVAGKMADWDGCTDDAALSNRARNLPQCSDFIRDSHRLSRVTAVTTVAKVAVLFQTRYDPPAVTHHSTLCRRWRAWWTGVHRKYARLRLQKLRNLYNVSQRCNLRLESYQYHYWTKCRKLDMLLIASNAHSPKSRYRTAGRCSTTEGGLEA